MSERLNADVIEAAGGIVVRDTPEGPLIAVIYRKRYGPEWALPKGKRQADESGSRPRCVKSGRKSA